MVKSTVYGNVTYNQISAMKHAIGFDHRKVRGTKYRKYEPYRNFYDAGPRDIAMWEELVSIGFAENSRGCLYHVTDDGRTFLGHVMEVEILPESK